ncbi:MAG TPA: hypothetical protein VN086_01600 [Candidatus Paceibacterota bacterium]|nr:hypothetical protein [Candidatus Paceibacterota bacterium]
MNKPVAGMLVSAIDANQQPKKICLCGRSSAHAARTDCIVAHPGTPWWNALRDAGPDDVIVVSLPNRQVELRVTDVKELSADVANAA